MPGIAAPQWEIDPVFSTGPAGVELFRVVAGRILRDGRVVVADGGNSEVLVLDAEGAVVDRLGQEGDGPGEYRRIASVHEADDGFLVYDTGHGRWTRYDHAGTVVSTDAMAPPNRVVDLRPLTVGADGDVIAIYGDMRRFGSDGIQRDTTPFLRYPAFDAKPDTLGSWPIEEWAYSATAGGAARTYVGFGRDLAASGRSGRSAVGDTDTLRIVVVAADGRPLLELIGPGASLPVDESDGERWRASVVDGLGDNVPDAIRERFARAPFRDTYPAFDDVAVDSDGRLWVGTTARFGVEDRLWVVFGTEGWPVGRILLPADATVLDIGHGRVLLMQSDELGVQEVSLHHIVAGGGSRG